LGDAGWGNAGVEGGRRIGKSSLDMLLAMEECIRTPGAIVGYIAPVREKLKGYIQPILAEVLADCPAHLKPEYLVNENALKFPNGAKILFVGSNNKSYITLRGFKLKAFLATSSPSWTILITRWTGF
jgi:hypothetical protein